jgi:hypothetical protein
MNADLLLYVSAGWLCVAVVSFGIRVAVERWFWRDKR